MIELSYGFLLCGGEKTWKLDVFNCAVFSFHKFNSSREKSQKDSRWINRHSRKCVNLAKREEEERSAVRSREEQGERGNAPPVITTATTESFVCALLPQSIVAQWNAPPSMSIVHTATSFWPLPPCIVLADSNALYTLSRFGLPMHLRTYTTNA